MGSHTHSIKPLNLVGGDEIITTLVHIDGRTLGVIEGKIYEFHGAFWKDPEGHLKGCHTLNCPEAIHSHWQVPVNDGRTI